MYIDKFADYLRLERNYSDKTVLSYREDLEQFRDFYLSLDPALDFLTVDRDVIRQWIVSLMDSGYKSTSVNRKLSTLRSFYRYLRLSGIADHSPAIGVKGPKNSKPLPQFVKESEMTELLDNTDLGTGFLGARNKAVLDILYETGIRLAELVGLNDSDINFDSRIIKVTGKRDKQRYIPFGHELSAVLQDYVELRDAEFGPQESDGPFFYGTKGGRIPRHQVYNLVHTSLAQVSTVKKKSPHVLRHTFATTMLNNDAELSAVKELLGHDSLATTQVYVHTTFEELKKIYKKAHPRD